MIVSGPSAAFEVVDVRGITGLIGTLEVRIDDNDGATVFGPTAAGISELGTSGVYSAELTAPAANGQFSILFSEDGSFDPETVSVEALLVTDAEPVSSLPPLVPLEGDAPLVGPWSLWTTAEDVAECCGNSEGSDDSIYDGVAVESSQVMYELSARKYGGIRERKVRPEPHPPGCGCGQVRVIRLAGRPIRSIVEVKIDGAVVDQDTYKLTRKGLLRVRDLTEPTVRLYWPCRQELDLPDTEEGTFSIRYLHGMDPPTLGQRAAAELACHLYRACTGGANCALPSGTVKVTRNNAVVEMRPFVNWAYDQKRGWETGMKLVDLFLSTYNPNAHRRRPAVWSPDVASFPRAEPIAGS
jgi:hypothetical protein